MTIEVKWSNWRYLFKPHQFFRFWHTANGWMGACGPINVLYCGKELT